MSSSLNKRQHAEMMDSLFNAIHEDDGIETAVLRPVLHCENRPKTGTEKL
jgi:hypothetical protein